MPIRRGIADPLYGKAEVAAANGALHVTYGRLTGPLTHWHHDTFQVAWDTRWRGERLIQFELSPGGEIAALIMGGSRLARSAP